MHQFLITNSDIITRLGIAMVLGMAIGAERLFVHKEAGMKTHALVALGAAVFVLIGEMIPLNHPGLSGFDPSRIASQIIVGVGFLGAGMIILREHGAHIAGLTTASGLWVSASIGIASGFGYFSLAIIVTVLVLFILTVLNLLEKPIRKMSEQFPPDQKN